MDWFTGTLLSALGAFVFSNFDDMILLCIWFGQTREVVGRVKSTSAAPELADAPPLSSSPPTSVQDNDDEPPRPANAAAFSRWHVVSGQVMGFGVLIIVSMIGFAVGTAIPEGWIGLLGFIPLLLGLRKLYQIVQETREKAKRKRELHALQAQAANVELTALSSSEDSVCMQQPVTFHDDEEAKETAPMTEENQEVSRPLPTITVEFEAHRPVAVTKQSATEHLAESPRSYAFEEAKETAPRTEEKRGVSQPLPTIADESEAANRPVSIAEPSATDQLAESSRSYADLCLTCLSVFVNRNSLKVASVTMSNGADNIGIYVPLFASSSVREMIVILVVFVLMVGVFLSVSYGLLYLPALARFISRYGAWLVPFALIALGFYIFYDTDVLSVV